MAHHMRPAGPGLCQDRQDVPGKNRDRVGADGFRLVGASVTAQVGDDDLEPGFGERGRLMPPEPGGVWKAVQQQDRRPTVTMYLVFNADPVDLYSGHARSPSQPESSRLILMQILVGKHRGAASDRGS
jgi:hypothetical protein